jgi:hypothetical protein
VFANVESDQAICGDRIRVLEIRDSLRAGKITGNLSFFDYFGDAKSRSSSKALATNSLLDRIRQSDPREQGMNPFEPGILHPRSQNRGRGGCLAGYGDHQII